MIDVCVIGHVTRDKIRIKNQEKKLPGGVAYYSPIILKNFGLNTCLVTKTAEKDKEILDDLYATKIKVYYRESQKTTAFDNVYVKELDIRKQNVSSVADPFALQEIPDISPRFFYLGPLTQEDIPLEIIESLSKKAKILLDIQGYLRKIDKTRVEHIDWEDKKEGLKHVNILKTDESEAQILSGENSIKKAAVQLSTYGIDEIIITQGSRGSKIYSKDTLYSIPAFTPRKLVDSTGCGDTYIAAYLYKKLTQKLFNIYESGSFAAATATLKLETTGPFRGTEEDVQMFLDLQSQ